MSSAGIVGLPDGRFIHPDDKDAYLGFQAAPSGQVHFLGSLDNLNHLRQQPQDLLDAGDGHLGVPSATSVVPLGGLKEFYSHIVACDGRIIGLWEFDVRAGEVVYCTWADFGSATIRAATKAEATIRAYLGDARSFSLDSPVSRAPRIELIRQIGKA